MTSEAQHSDTESNLSLDSLEENIRSYAAQNVRDKKCSQENVTIPYYRGEISVNSLKNNELISKGKYLNSPSPKRSYEGYNSLRGSYFSCNTRRTVSARVDCGQRLSRRSTSLIPNSDSVRTRHRSISYLEQFRKKLYGTHKTDSTMHLNVDPDESEKDLSLVSFSKSEQQTTTSSEFEFYQDLINDCKNKPLRSSTQIQDESDMNKSTSRKSSTVNQKKNKPVVLVKIDQKKQEEKNAIDKKNALEKQKAYANKVKLKNQIKMMRQKENEKQEKLKVHNDSKKSSLKLNTSNQKDGGGDMASVPFALNVVDFTTKPRRKQKKKSSTKCKNGSKTKNLVKDSDELINLKTLQQRHEKEKQLVQSMKNSILKK